MRILLALPRYKSEVCIATAQAFYHATAQDSPHEVRAISPSSSLATSCFNSCWAMARNEWEADRIDAFAMIHSDVAPPIHWIDVMAVELEKVGADIISAVIPIKDNRGLSSTAVEDTGDEWRHRRLTMTEAKNLPVTFTDDDVGAPILLNTGLWLAKLGPWCTEVFFRVREHMRRDASQGGLWVPRCVSEDWDFSMQCRTQGVKLAATTAVEVEHYGEHKWTNREVWGWETDHQNAPTAVGAETDGWRFPADVDGWLTETEGACLSKFAERKRVLEIGSYCGRSTICMAQSASVVHVVDPFDGRDTPGLVNTRAKFWENVARYGCSGKVIEHVGTSQEMVPTLNKNFDLAFIDGAHTYRSVIQDVGLAASVLKPDGLLALHDYRSEPGSHDGRWNPGVTKAIDDLIEHHGIELIEVAGTVAIARPIKKPALAEVA